MTLAGKHILVVGAGVGGLAAALALLQRGARVRIFEQAQAITEVGAGLQISPNGTRVLRALGLGEALYRQGIEAQAVELCDHRQGRRVMRLEITQSQAGHFLLHRADLIRMLARAVQARGGVLRLNAKAVAVVPGASSHKPQVALEDGSAHTADVIVGADGLHGVARSALNHAQAPFFTGQVAWRALLPNPWNPRPHAPLVRVYMGPGRHLVSYPLRAGRLINLVAVQERKQWAQEGWHHPDTPQVLRQAFADFGPRVRHMLDAVQQLHRWGLFCHPIAECWQGGAVALVGDAAHPMLPFMAQGAVMGLEDAWVLAEALAQHHCPAEALAHYQKQRKPRVKRVVKATNRNAWAYHLRPGPLRFMAHTGLRLGGCLMARHMLSQWDWLYHHNVISQDT
ncbi:MAG: FAD-dependent monooxygenase [Rhodobacteraceae bacterium]|nr:FAD-dependent monooxygenase [Paracoccaceae bacterium]